MRWTLALVMCLGAAGRADVVYAQDDQKRVLVLHASRRDAQFTATVETRLPSMLENGLPEGLDYYSEFIDQPRFQRPEYQSAFRGFLQMKYRGQHLDAIILSGNAAIEFLASSRDLLFPDTPIVFYTNMPLARRLPNSTGIVNLFRFGRSIELALALQPDLQHLFVVNGFAPADRRMERQARQEFERFTGRLDVSYLTGLASTELETRVKALPPRSAVFYGLVSEDGAGEKFQTTEYLTRLAALANAPIYSWVDISTDTGIVGGSQRNQLAQIRGLAELTLRVLRGERADDIPLSTADTDVNQVDWRQLQRWGIAAARIPQGTVVTFRTPTPWERYRGYIIATVTILLAQAALIAGLLVQRRRRRLAEAQVRGGQEALRDSHERIRALGSRLLTAQDSERARIARDLHDDISQQIALLSIDLELLNRSIAPENEALASDALIRTEVLARSVHEISHRLHPAKLRLIGLVASLQALQRELSRSDQTITFTHEGVPADLPADLTLSLFRAAQAILQNAVKHSKAREIRVHLQGSAQGLVLMVEDDGIGFDVSEAWGRGLGLISVAERIETLGGTFDVRAVPGAGTSVTIRVPRAAGRADGTEASTAAEYSALERADSA
jgi:signal transduction histidine kinase